MVIERGRRRRRRLPHRPPAKSARNDQKIVDLGLTCTNLICQDNLFPTINIHFQHMEISVKRSLLVFLLLLTLLSPSTLSARPLTDLVTQQRSTKPTTTTTTAAAPARL